MLEAMCLHVRTPSTIHPLKPSALMQTVLALHRGAVSHTADRGVSVAQSDSRHQGVQANFCLRLSACLHPTIIQE